MLFVYELELNIANIVLDLLLPCNFYCSSATGQIELNILLLRSLAQHSTEFCGSFERNVVASGTKSLFRDAKYDLINSSFGLYSLFVDGIEWHIT